MINTASIGEKSQRIDKYSLRSKLQVIPKILESQTISKFNQNYGEKYKDL